MQLVPLASTRQRDRALACAAAQASFRRHPELPSALIAGQESILTLKAVMKKMTARIVLKAPGRMSRGQQTDTYVKSANQASMQIQPVTTPRTTARNALQGNTLQVRAQHRNAIVYAVKKGRTLGGRQDAPVTTNVCVECACTWLDLIAIPQENVNSARREQSAQTDLARYRSKIRHVLGNGSPSRAHGSSPSQKKTWASSD